MTLATLPRVLLAACLLGAGAAAHAEAAAPVALPAGTSIQLAVEDEVSSATAVQGQRFTLIVSDDVIQQGQLLIPRGTPALGTVLGVERSGRMGAGGMLSLKIDYLQLGQQRVRLHRTLSSADKSSEIAAAVLTSTFGPFGIFKRGKDIVVAAGTRISASTKDLVEIVPAIGGGSETNP